MGWFWADTQASQPIAPHPLPRGDAAPPPGCPMHKKDGSSSPPPLASMPSLSEPNTDSACPYKPPTTSTSSPTQPTGAASTLSKLNPLNMMPTSSNERSTTQTIALELDRETSTIPRGDKEGGTWEYPSPQQMYNAMLRKGYTDTDITAVPAMVSVHNFLNEGAWGEILAWESRFSQGLRRGWECCRYGEENGTLVADILERRERMAGGSVAGQKGLRDRKDPSLVRFMGRPDEPTPKARMMQFLGWVWPTRYASEPPFDRHDWYVRREGPDGESEVRYVIDYYSGPPEPTGEPVFFLDVRPAVDGPTAACERLMRWGGDVWWRASGGSVRAELERQKAKTG